MAGQVIVTIGDKEWLASLASAPWELVQGLGGVSGMDAGTGMLFDLGFEQDNNRDYRANAFQSGYRFLF